MLSLAKARKDYYLQKVGEITPREDYYLRGGTAVGHWHGSGADKLGVSGTVTAEGLVRLFDGQHPETGEQLGRQLRKDGVAAWDLTFSADKSVSLLWAFGGDEVRRHVVEAFEEATAEALTYLESVASSTRGADRVPVVDHAGRPVLDDEGNPRQRVETWPIRTTGYVSAWFTEFTSRADDPQLHTHVVVGNRVQGVDGVWRAIDGRLLYRHQLAAGYLHEAELRRRLTDRLGVRWQPVHNGMADIEGFTREQITTFSRRRQEIEEWRDSHGLADTPAGNEAATLATRTPKKDHPVDVLMADWLERGNGVDVTPKSVAALLGRESEVQVPEPEAVFDQLASAEGLTRQASTFSRADVIQAIAQAHSEGGHRVEIEALADTFLGWPGVIPILPVHNVSDLADVPLANADSAGLDYLAELVSSTAAATWEREADLVRGLMKERRYTTAELLEVEQSVIDRGVRGVGADRWAVPTAAAEQAQAARPDLTDGQRQMVRQFATSGDTIDIGVGAAGTGKTAVMAIIGELARQSGTPIIGTALAARAAAGLQTATGIPSATLTRFVWEAEMGGGLPSGAIVVVDEAGMVGSRQIAQVTDLVEAAGGKLILIGDHRQLAEIDAGGLFAALTVRLPAVHLTENVRQTEAWERAALEELRDGSISLAVAMYNSREKIRTAPTSSDTITAAVEAWYRDIQETEHPRDVLLIGDRNTTVNHLNQLARARFAGDGRLTGPAVVSSDRTLQTGERVVCLKNRSRLGVLNGDLGSVTAVDAEQRSITVRLDRTGHPVTIPSWYLEEGNLDWGYAFTGHKAQGATARRAHTVASDGVDREWLYVTMSRGREANTIYLTDPDIGESECTHLTHQHPERLPALIASLRRTAAERAALDTGRGPQNISDKQLNQRVADLAVLLARSAGTNPCPGPFGDHESALVEDVDLHREVHARHRDRLATIAYEPPRWIVDAIGERPAEANRRYSWDRIVDSVVRYRASYSVPDDSGPLLGPKPPSVEVEQHTVWIASHRAVEREQHTLSADTTHGIETLGR